MSTSFYFSKEGKTLVATKRKSSEKTASADEMLKRYEEIFENISCFTDAISNAETEIEAAREKVAAAKSQLKDAEKELDSIQSIADGNRLALFRYLHPKSGQIMPLFDRMEPADEQIHGENSTEWRKEPIAELKLSLVAVKSLTDADIVLVGQLQDLVLADGKSWWEKIPGLSHGIAMAIADRLNDFIFKRSQ